MGNAERLISQNGEDLTDAYSPQTACEPEVESRYSLPQALEEAYTPSGQVTCEHGRGLGDTCDECTDSRQTGKTTATVILFKPSGKYYTQEEWEIPAGAIVPSSMRRSPDFRRIDGGAVLVETQEPWGFPHLFPGVSA